MIKANELRIKNLVTLNEKQRKDLWNHQIHAQNDFFEVKTIYSDNDISIELDDEIIDISENDVDPIQLTEEWLLKLGFKKDGRDWELPNFRFHVNKPINYNGFVFCNGYTVITEKIQYVHQLQNLYFALTGAELTVA